MKYLSLIVVVWLLVGCTVDADPMRSASAKAKADQSDIAVSQNNAQISQVQQADADARRAQEELHRLQLLAAERTARAIEAEAQADQNIAETNSAAQVAALEILAAASKPDHTALYVVLVVLLVVLSGGAFLVWRMFITVAQPQPQLAPAPTYRALPSAPPARIQWEADKRNAVAVWDVEGRYWFLHNYETGQTWTLQRKQIAAN